MKTLITGGAGFIGSHIVEALVQKNHEVRILDNFSTGKRGNISHLENRIEIIEGDLADKKTVDKAIEGMECVFHQAAQVSVIESMKNPAKTWDTNIKGTKLLLNAAVKYKVKKIIFASSAAVYGNEPGFPKREDMVVRPTSPYGNSKRIGELLAEEYHRKYKLNAICLRYFNVYGPRQSPWSEYSGVISKFVSKMLKGERPVIYGDGKQTRDFVYVKDVVSANLLAMEKPVGFGVYNIATGKETTLLELTQTINEILGTEIEPVFEPERPGDIKRSVADISKAIAELGYEPKYTLKIGLEETIEWYKKEHTSGFDD
ncbi:MAG: SDR family oxidoreductase [Candidatus Bilamarchaeaceae archaeon]